MAGARHTMRATARANTINLDEIATAACSRAARIERRVRGLADAIAEAMEELHGGSFRIQIEHSCGLIAITKSLHEHRRPIDPDSLREAV